MSEVEDRIDSYSAAVIELQSGGTEGISTRCLQLIIDQCQAEIDKRGEE